MHYTKCNSHLCKCGVFPTQYYCKTKTCAGGPRGSSNGSFLSLKQGRGSQQKMTPLIYETTRQDHHSPETFRDILAFSHQPNCYSTKLSPSYHLRCNQIRSIKAHLKLNGVTDIHLRLRAASICSLDKKCDNLKSP